MFFNSISSSLQGISVVVAHADELSPDTVQWHRKNFGYPPWKCFESCISVNAKCETLVTCLVDMMRKLISDRLALLSSGRCHSLCIGGREPVSKVTLEWASVHAVRAVKTPPEKHKTAVYKCVRCDFHPASVPALRSHLRSEFNTESA